MTITHARAKALLDAAKIKGATVAAESLAGERLPEVTDCGDGATIADTSTPAVAALMAAAPDLARTVIDQAEELDRIRSLALCLVDRHKRDGHEENAHETALLNRILREQEADQ